MRTLYHVPLVHSSEELGSLKDWALAQRIRQYGSDGAQAFTQSVHEYWQEVERRIEKKFSDVKTVKGLHVFVDSMPDTHDELIRRIISELAGKNISLYATVEKLMHCGAHVHATEDLSLLLAERAYWQRVAAGQPRDLDKEAALLVGRDNYIARCIDASLPQDGIGLLFLGQLHNIHGALERQSIRCTVVDL